MKKMTLFYALILFIGISISSCRTDDLKTTKNVETALIENNIMATSSVKNGIVTLTGEVESEEAKAKAEELIKSIKGVRRIVNDLAVVVPEPPKPVVTPDDSLKIVLVGALESAGYYGVGVDVAEQEVVLTGDVKKADLKKIVKIVNDAKPKKVTNNLKGK